MKQKLIPCANILSFTCMPNHYHIMAQLRHDDLSRAMQKFMRSYAGGFNGTHGRDGPLFQGRFCAKHVTDDNYLLWLSRYQHLNALDAHLVDGARDWPYSSYPDYLQHRDKCFVDTDLVLQLAGGRAAYEAFVESTAHAMPIEFQAELDAFLNSDDWLLEADQMAAVA